MKNKKPFLAILLSILLLGLAGCTKTEEPASTPKADVPVRVLTSIELGGFSPFSTRANVHEPDDNITGGTEEGNDAESKIHTIRLMAFDLTNNKVAVNQFYRAPGASVTGAEKNYKFKDLSGANKLVIQLDLKILTGDYEFVLIANEYTEWNLTSFNENKSKSDLEGLINSNFYSLDDTHGIPMIGDVKLTIPFVSTVSETNPYTPPQTIMLKRTLAKLDIVLTRTTEAANQGVTVKSVVLRNLNTKYNVLEGISTSPVESLNNETPTINPSLYPLSINKLTCERKGVTEANATAIDIVLTKEGVDVPYTVLLYQKRADKTKDYNVYRNTIYRFNMRIIGSDRLIIDLEATPWENVEIGVSL